MCRRRQACHLGAGKINCGLRNRGIYADGHMAATSGSSESVPGLYVSKIASSNTTPSCEVELAACECCGLTEECTPSYIAGVRERFHGRWVCGLCGEAVKDELLRSGRLIEMEEALEAHMTFCMQFRADPAVRLVGAMRQLLRKCLDSSCSPRGGVRSSPTNPRVYEKDINSPGFARSTTDFNFNAGSMEDKNRDAEDGGDKKFQA